MAILDSAQWWVRAGGNALNGGGFDSAISGAGTNYCDQDAAQLSLTDFATSGAGVTTLTSATGGFTSAMVGNCIRIASGTNFQTGYYFVTVYTDANTVTLDRTPTSGGAGSGGTGRLGGAFATPWGNLCTGGGVAAPTITSPLAAGHVINVRGAGSSIPGSADYTMTSYANWPSGDSSSGAIRLVGYNGRPRIDVQSIFLNGPPGSWVIEDVVFVVTGTDFASSGVIQAGPASTIRNVRIDQAGYDRVGARVTTAIGCAFVNSGSSAPGTYNALNLEGFGGSAFGCYIDGWRGGGIVVASAINACIQSNVVARTRAGRGLQVQIAYGYASSIISGNVLHDNAGDGLRIVDTFSLMELVIANNIITDNDAFGLKVAAGTAALNDRCAGFCDFNAFRGNASGARDAISAGDNDITLSADPFTNAPVGDFTLNNTAGGGADLRGVAFPTSIP